MPSDDDRVDVDALDLAKARESRLRHLLQEAQQEVVELRAQLAALKAVADERKGQA